MGMPEIIIDFKTAAQTAVTRSERGVVAVILRDNTVSSKLSYTYAYYDDVNTAEWTQQNAAYLQLVFAGAPMKVIVERVYVTETTEGEGNDAVTTDDFDERLAEALGRLNTKVWNWLTMPGADADTTVTLAAWIKTKRAASRTFKAVLANSASNSEGIVNLTTTDIVSDVTGVAATYTPYEYAARIAGVLAGLALTRSATFYVLSDVSGVTENATPDADIDAGKLIIVNDGTVFKIARAVTSLVTPGTDQTADMKSIKIVEGIDLIRDDIKKTFEDNYIGEINSYDNKMLFVSAVNQYLSELTAEGVLYAEGVNRSDIDTDATRSYLITQGVDVSALTEDEIRRYNTGTWMFLRANITLQNAAEDLKFTVYID